MPVICFQKARKPTTSQLLITLITKDYNFLPTLHIVNRLKVIFQLLFLFILIIIIIKFIFHVIHSKTVLFYSKQHIVQIVVIKKI